MERKQNHWGLVLLAALMGGTLWFVLRDSNAADVKQAMAHINPLFLLFGLGLMLVFVGSEALCSRIILGKLGHAPSYRQCLGYSFIGFYVSSITPSATGGQPAQIYQMGKDGIPAAHGALNMMLIAVCYQLVSLGTALAAFVFLSNIRAALGGALGILLLFGAAVVSTLTVGMLLFLFLPHAAAKLVGGILTLLVRIRIVKNETSAREKLARQMAEYRMGADCLRRNPGLLPKLLAITFVQLTALFSVPYVVYLAFGLSGASLVQMVGMQAIISLAVGSLPLPGAMGAAEGGFVQGFALFFGAGLVAPAVLISRGISFYSFLFLSAVITLFIQVSNRKRSALPARKAQATAKTRRSTEAA